MNFAKIIVSSVLSMCLVILAVTAVWAFEYDSYSDVLKNYVDNDGFVNYSALKDNADSLNKFIDQIKTLDKTNFENWQEEEKIAFWINVYNAIALKIVSDHYPIKPDFIQKMFYPENSIRQINGSMNGIKFKVMGDKITLDKIEKSILIKEYREPRVLVALVCAALGCPPLRNEPYNGDNLDYQLNDQARRFLAEPGNFRIDKKNSVVYLPAIFKTAGEHFVDEYLPEEKFESFAKNDQAVLNFISSYLDKQQRQYLLDYDFSINYIDFDWNLNTRKWARPDERKPVKNK